MCQCNKYCNKCTTLVLDVDREVFCVCEREREMVTGRKGYTGTLYFALNFGIKLKLL